MANKTLPEPSGGISFSRQMSFDGHDDTFGVSHSPPTAHSGYLESPLVFFRKKLNWSMGAPALDHSIETSPFLPNRSLNEFAVPTPPPQNSTGRLKLSIPSFNQTGNLTALSMEVGGRSTNDISDSGFSLGEKSTSRESGFDSTQSDVAVATGPRVQSAHVVITAATPPEAGAGNKLAIPSRQQSVEPATPGVPTTPAPMTPQLSLMSKVAGLFTPRIGDLPTSTSTPSAPGGVVEKPSIMEYISKRQTKMNRKDLNSFTPSSM